MTVIDHIYDALTDAECLAELPGHLADLVGARACTLQEFGKDREFVLLIHNGYYTQEMYDFYVSSEMYRHDPWREPVERRGLNQFCISSEILNMDDYFRSVFFNEFYRKFGDDTVHCLGCVAPHRNGVFLIGLHRGMGAEPFTAAERGLVQPLIPHLSRLFEVQNTFLKSEARSANLEQLISAMPQAILVLDELGRLEYANRPGERLFAPGGPLTVRGRKVCARERASDTALSSCVASAAAGAVGQGGAIQLATEHARFRAVVAPWRRRERTQVVIVVDSMDVPDPHLTTKLVGLFGFTTAEAEVITKLSEGATPAEVADRRGVSIVTVRSQIQQALRKADARTLTDLLRVAVSLPRFSPPGA